MDTADAFASTSMFEGTWRSDSVSGSIETARAFYGKFLPGKNLDLYFAKINNGKIMNNVHAHGPNVLRSQRFFRDENETVIPIGDEQTIDLTEGTPDPIAGAGDAKIDLHWNTEHSAIVGSGNLPGCTEEFSASQEITDDGNTLVKTFTHGSESWTISYKKASGDGFANTGMYEGTWKSTSISGDMDTARDFYGKCLPGKNIEMYFSKINSGNITINIYAPGSNTLISERFLHFESGEPMRLGDEHEKIDLTVGTMDPVPGAGNVKVDLHWNAKHTAFEGSGLLPSHDQAFSFSQKLEDDGKKLVRDFSLGDKTWTIYFKKDHGFLSAKSFEGTWVSSEVKGATDAAYTFYTTLLPGKDIDQYFTLINNKKMMNSMHATGLNSFTRETYYLNDSGAHVKCGEIQTIDLTEGNLDPIAGAGNATVDLHWDHCHSAFVANGKLAEFPEGFSFRAELEDDGNTLVRAYTLGNNSDKTWSIIWKRQ